MLPNFLDPQPPLRVPLQGLSRPHDLSEPECLDRELQPSRAGSRTSYCLSACLDWAEYSVQPIGVGYSYGTMVNNSRAAAYDVYDFLLKFFHLYPHLAKCASCSLSMLRFP